MVAEGTPPPKKKIQERNDTIEKLMQYLEETAQELEQHEEWYETYEQQVVFTKTNQLFRGFNGEEESEAEAQA